MYIDFKEAFRALGWFCFLKVLIGVGIWFEYQKIHACVQAFGLDWFQCFLLFGSRGSK